MGQRKYQRSNKPRPLSERFWEKVDKRGCKKPNMRTRCWVWCGGNNGKYGSLQNEEGKREYVHRISWRMRHQKSIPKDLEIDHLCRTRLCVRPSHLEAVNHRENVRRNIPFIPKRRKTHCFSGHDLEQHGYISPRGVRFCRLCHADADLQRKRRLGVRARGTFIPRHHVKISEEQVQEIRRLHGLGAYSQSQLGNLFGVSQTTVGRYIRGERYADLPKVG